METPQGLKVAIYARVSTEQNQNLQTPEMQLYAARDLGIRNGFTWAETDEYVDYESGKSVAVTQRPKFLELFEHKLSQYQGLVVYAIDRLFRDGEDGMHYGNMLAKAGIYVFETTSGLIYWGPIPDPTMELIWMQKVGYAQFERKVISKRVTDGIARKRREAEAQGIPFRWAQKTKDRGVALQPLDEQRIVELHSAGYTFVEIAQELGVGRMRVTRAFKRMEKEKAWAENRLNGRNEATIEPG